MQDFKRLRVWHLARKLALQVIEALPPKTSRIVPGLRSQAIRAAASIADNLAEGCGRATRPQFLNFTESAFASLNELDGQLDFARDAKVIPRHRHAEIQRDIRLVRHMLLSLIDTLQRRIAEDESKRRRKKGGDDN